MIPRRSGSWYGRERHSPESRRRDGALLRVGRSLRPKRSGAPQGERLARRGEPGAFCEKARILIISIRYPVLWDMIGFPVPFWQPSCFAGLSMLAGRRRALR